MAKETPAARIQRIKTEKSGLDVLADIKRYAADASIELDPEDIDRFKWYGLYSQNKSLQPEGDESLYFMLRIKLEKGSMNLEQIKEVAKISHEHATKNATFTTRQDLQFHNIQVKNLPEIFDRLQSVGLSTVFAAGDVPRNVLTCPVMGVDHTEITDVNDTVQEVYNFLGGNKDLVNLPRKFKVGISACSKHCMGHEIQDVSFTAVQFENEVLFDVSVGGGLASNKQIAQHIGYVKEEQILDVVKVVAYTFRDHGLREKRNKARLGHLIAEWGIEKFTEYIQSKLDFTILPKQDQVYTTYAKREHFGIHPSKVENTSYIGCAVTSGKIGAEGLDKLAITLEKFGANTIKATPTQNFIIVDAPTHNAQAIVDELKTYGIDANPSPFKSRTLSCTGLDFCKFAVSETKAQSADLISFLEKRFPDFTEPLSVSFNGCTNTCAQAHIVNIGFIGTKVKDNEGNNIPGFTIILGGNLEGNQSIFGEKTKIKIRPDQINGVVEKIILAYEASEHTVLHDFMREISIDKEFVQNLL